MFTSLPAPLHYSILLLLLSQPSHAYPGLISNGPAPSPEDGPPLSAHASRDRSLLPAQICGIVGGYVVTVLIWGVLLLTVGRRMRRNTENSPKTLELQLVTNRPVTNNPISPASARSATSWFKRSFKKDAQSETSSIQSPVSPTVNSPSSFDHKVIETDRERAQAEMERLYAAVADHERKKSQTSINLKGYEEETPRQNFPPRINTSGRPTGTTQSNPGSPRSPVKAIYPPNYIHNGPPTAPLPRQKDDRPSSPRSILSKKSHSSSSSKPRFNLKNLRISGPVQKYPGEIAHDEARTPLSPRFYSPGAPPSPPTIQNTPTSPDEAYEGLDEVQPLPHPAPQRKGSYAPSPTVAKSATSSSNSLPLRGYTPEGPLSPSLKTTYVDHRREQLSLTTPKTGATYTPYSPYMPFTPITPVTPHLVTKKERKREKKINGRKLKTAEDMVQSPKDIFGDAW